MEDKKIAEKISRLTPREVQRLGQMMLAIPKMIDGMITCEGPDDAKIATCAAIATVFGLDSMPNPHMAQALCAEITVDFCIESLIARRKLYEERMGKKAHGV